jgi:hypothetical protein
VTIDPATGHATPTADYYVLGHVTRFIRPGAVRVDSTVAGNAWNVAFRNPDGSIVLVVVNDDWGTTTQHFNFAAAGSRSRTHCRRRGRDLRAAARRVAVALRPISGSPPTSMGDPGLEPGTSSLSEKRSNRLS